LVTFLASPAERTRQKRQLTEQAVKLAMQNQWQEAVEVNRQIIELAPDEADAWNRLGKALSELGRYAEALDAYNEALKRDPNNMIARKQVKRLSLLVEAAAAPAEEARDKLDPRLLIEETGKTAIFELESPAPPATLAHMAAGDQVYLKSDGNVLRVENKRGEVLGNIPARAALRLIELMNSGNRYVAGVTSVTDRQIRVLVREIYQAPQNQGRVSFPSKGAPLPPELRAHERALRLELEELYPEEFEEEEEGLEGEVEGEETTTDIEYYEEGEHSAHE
jgi:tetratricopeptide (TPR) repeat protein